VGAKGNPIAGKKIHPRVNRPPKDLIKPKRMTKKLRTKKGKEVVKAIGL